jgi:hypothetical protein
MSNLEDPAVHLLEQIEQLLPAFIADLLVLLVGVIVAGLAGMLLRRIAKAGRAARAPALSHGHSDAVI